MLYYGICMLDVHGTIRPVTEVGRAHILSSPVPEQLSR
jgi:hypothetical protein